MYELKLLLTSLLMMLLTYVIDVVVDVIIIADITILVADVIVVAATKLTGTQQPPTKRTIHSKHLLFSFTRSNRGIHLTSVYNFELKIKINRM